MILTSGGPSMSAQAAKCPVCGGKGYKKGFLGLVRKKCSACRGSGRVESENLVENLGTFTPRELVALIRSENTATISLAINEMLKHVEVEPADLSAKDEIGENIVKILTPPKTPEPGVHYVGGPKIETDEYLAFMLLTDTINHYRYEYRDLLKKRSPGWIGAILDLDSKLNDDTDYIIKLAQDLVNGKPEGLAVSEAIEIKAMDSIDSHTDAVEAPFSEFASDLRCQYCGKQHGATAWPQNGDMVAFYFQKESGQHSLEVKCPHCGKDWYVVWDDNPGPILPLKSTRNSLGIESKFDELASKDEYFYQNLIESMNTLPENNLDRVKNEFLTLTHKYSGAKIVTGRAEEVLNSVANCVIMDCERDGGRFRVNFPHEFIRDLPGMSILGGDLSCMHSICKVGTDSYIAYIHS